jgi:hypothetical protein
MTEFFNPHEMINFDSLWLANSVDIIPCQINQHDMLGTVFL